MCGVVGYVGHRPAQTRLLGALARLEYRGYDSAGICLGEARGLRSVKTVGNLARLRAEVEAREGSRATIGVGHTRWATHGRVSVENAHPLAGDHEDELAIVLNGIVENFSPLRDELRADGAVFRSETDAEVVVHLVERAYDGDLVAAVRAAVARLRGHFAFVVIHRDHPDLLVGARRRCPLVVGIGDDETFVASSATAFAGETRRQKLVDDGEIVAIRPRSIVFFGADGERREHPEVMVARDDGLADKRGHETFMLKEIHEQPDAVARSLYGIDADIDAVAQEGILDPARVRRIVVVACGTAFHAGALARHAIEGVARIPCDVEAASEWRYRDPVVAARHASKPFFFYLGRGAGLPVALEGALKLQRDRLRPDRGVRGGRDEARPDRAASTRRRRSSPWWSTRPSPTS